VYWIGPSIFCVGVSRDRAALLSFKAKPDLEISAFR
jgi:hypothetical protein